MVPRVEGLAESLGTPVPEGEVKEIKRRQKLKRQPAFIKVKIDPDAQFLGNWKRLSETWNRWQNAEKSRVSSTTSGMRRH